MPYTYPPASPTISGDVVSTNRFLNSPTMYLRRLRSLLEQRYIADALLTVPLRAEGGAIVYETGEAIFADRDPRAVAPGSEYPLTTLGSGTPSLAKTSKWGEDAIVTDEAIARQNFAPVDRAMTKLVNSNVRFIDSLAMSAISSAVTASTGATAAFATATAAQILDDVTKAKAAILALNQGFEPDTVVLNDTQYANVLSKFVQAGIVPRETNALNPAMTGELPNILGMRWLPTPNALSSTVLIVDSRQLGGMADENIGGPGYTGQGPSGVDGKAIREDKEDRWRLRARRVTVPVVLEPAAGYKLTSA